MMPAPNSIIVAEMRTPAAKDATYRKLLFADYSALLLRPEVRADDELLMELIDGLDRLFAAHYGLTVGFFRALMRGPL